MPYQAMVESLQQDIEDLRSRLAISEETIRAIQSGEVDALVVNSDEGAQVFTLKGAEHPYRVLVEEMSQGAATLASDGTLAFCNLRFAQMLRQPLEMLAGRDLSQLVDNKDQGFFDGLKRQGWNATSKGEVGFRTGDGSTVSAYLTLSPVNIGNEILLCMVATDLSEQKRDEALLAEERLARSILESIADGILVCDTQGRIIRANEVASRIAGRYPIFEDIDTLLDLVDEHEQAFSIRQAMAGDKRRGLLVTSRVGAEPFHLLLSIGPIMTSSGDLLGAVITLTDRTERSNFEQDLARAKKVAVEANQAKSAFLANMSHEIRTPLGAILGFAELLKEADLTDEDKNNFIATITRNGHALSHLIDDILDLSKVEAGKIEFENIEFSPLPLLAEIQSFLGILAHGKGIQLNIKVEGEVPELALGDCGRIRQILVNIIGNAIKFTKQGAVTVTLKVNVPEFTDRCNLLFLVQDSGCGITTAQQATLFQSFVQADSTTTRKFGGTGLGLVLSKGLAIAMGGDVTIVNSRPDQGSLFSIVVPVQIPQLLTPHQPVAEASPEKATSVDLSGMCILVVDDVMDNQILIKRLLSRSGAKVDLASNGLEAIELALGNDYDLILMDIQMPTLDGHAATLKLRAKAYEKPIIALTAHAMAEERDQCLRSGCNGFLTKPIDHTLLLNTVALYAPLSRNRNYG